MDQGQFKTYLCLKTEQRCLPEGITREKLSGKDLCGYEILTRESTLPSLQRKGFQKLYR